MIHWPCPLHWNSSVCRFLSADLVLAFLPRYIFNNYRPFGTQTLLTINASVAVGYCLLGSSIGTGGATDAWRMAVARTGYSSQVESRNPFGMTDGLWHTKRIVDTYVCKLLGIRPPVLVPELLALFLSNVLSVEMLSVQCTEFYALPFALLCPALPWFVVGVSAVPFKNRCSAHELRRRIVGLSFGPPCTMIVHCRRNLGWLW